MAVQAFLGCLVHVLPFGWMVGVAAAIVLTGAIGQLPVMTVPLGILGAGIFAVLPMVLVNTRLSIMAFGTVGLWLLSMAAMWRQGMSRALSG